MDPLSVIVVGASAGGVEALRSLVGGIPAQLNAAVLVVLHIPTYARTELDSILSRAGPLPAKVASDGDRLHGGTIYVAPNDHHLLIEDKRLRLTRGPRENRVRPCIDVLFRSAALEFGHQVIGIVLSGLLDDGTAGLWAIKDRGGLTIVQTPSEAQHAGMPESALQHVAIDYATSTGSMGALLLRLSSEPRPIAIESPPRRSLKLETKIAIEGNALKRGVMEMGEISKNTCPECHGVLVKIREGSVLRFRCHTGHAYSLNALLAETDEAIEASLWGATRAIEERAVIMREKEALASLAGDEGAATLFATQAENSESRAQRVRDLLVSNQQPP